MSKDYVVITAISMYRMRYVMHRDDLLQVAEEHLDWRENLIECARDIVSSEECEEFSQEHVGESIVDTVEMTESDILELFDKENDYLSEWPREQKLSFIKSLVSWKRRFLLKYEGKQND